MVTADNSRLRILHLILVLGETNGQYNEHCLPLMHERDLTICTYFPPKLTPPEEIALFPGDGSIGGFYRALKAALDAKPYDVIHVHAPQSGGLVLVGLLMWRRFRRLRPSLVYTVQDSFYDYSLRNQLLTLVSLAGFDRIIFCSQSAYESVPSPWRQRVRAKARVVANGADIARVDRAINQLEPGASRIGSSFRVVWVGRMEKVKDPGVVVSAFAAVDDPATRMVMIGAGQLDGEVARQVASLGLNHRVELTGLIPRDEVFVKCAEADLFVSASRGEGLPVAVIEAMATECPVILSDIPPHREVRDGAEFIPLVRLGDVDGFADEIRRFQEMSPEQRADIGRRSREHVLARFSLPIMHAAVEAVYRERAEPVGAAVRP
jgi:glycosyltransferase involved in cell wall biosynthesis